MASGWRKAMDYLGLGPDEQYDEYDVTADERPAPPAERDGARPRPAPARPAGGGGTAPTRTRPAPPPAGSDPEGSSVRTLAPQGGGETSTPRPKPVVRAVSASAKPHVVVPRTFNHAQEIADKFKASQPVIVNMQTADRELSRRLIDFCSGLCYGLGGNMEKVATQVYLLTPTNVEVSAEERRRLSERGLYDA